MMIGLGVSDARDREIVRAKVRSMLAKGAPGLIRLVKNGLRVARRRWGAGAGELRAAGFVDVEVELLEHEGGLAATRRPDHPSDDV